MDILVYAESRGGKLRPAGLEAVSFGRKLADSTGGNMTTVLIGTGLETVIPDAEKYGSRKILTVDAPELAGYTPEGYREAIISAAGKTGAKLVIMAATAMGRDLAPTVAARMDASLLPDCTAVEFSNERLNVTRPVYAGRCIMSLAATELPVVLSIRPKAFLPQVWEGNQAAKEKLEVDLNGKIRGRLVETRVEAGEKLDVTEADVIVAGGRGLKAAENFGMIEELANLLGGAVGASRAVVDTEWRPHSEQVGQTGKVVSPTLYIAAGISGAIQHLAGMRTSKVIVAINKDPEAPIFKSADYGIVGDALEVIPALTKAIREYN